MWPKPVTKNQVIKDVLTSSERYKSRNSMYVDAKS